MKLGGNEIVQSSTPIYNFLEDSQELADEARGIDCDSQSAVTF